MGVKRPWEYIWLAFLSKGIDVWKFSLVQALEQGGSPTGEGRPYSFAWLSWSKTISISDIILYLKLIENMLEYY